MPFVHIEMVEGRTVEQKRELAKRVTEAVAEITNVPADRVHVFFNDMKKEDYANGGTLVLDK
ncbi:2-hydroxymuconate tautomerase family protein [Tumebacillus sp. ITR2]|uniref:Tautomerase n=1 Tax=Tumebacillus amylolyticus TaxID=2801339 RepID=A0ABS1JAC9_9BACL|nr:2-hydroxymuconate tautomerase [Tumebacillus amylolyticus]MBL0387228.1 2-hydroxymuconate tautomerase family protein [Tumebacillus amylolyticus]